MGSGIKFCGHVHTGFLFSVMQMEFGPQTVWSQGLMQRPFLQTDWGGQSLSPFGQLPSRRQPEVYGSPTLFGGHLHLCPDGVGSQMADGWQGFGRQT